MSVGLVNFFLMVAMCGLEASCDDEDAPELVQMHGKYGDRCFVVSRRDVERVRKHKWVFWGDSGYPHCKAAGGGLHLFIIGERPSNVPEDWVVDHANGDRMDARMTNLRWVSPRFNAWNKKESKSSTKYRGVYNKFGKWQARSLSCHLGSFESEREAGIACAKHAIKEFGEWAVTSHVLLSTFPYSELVRMKAEVDAGEYVTCRQKALPRGVTYNKKEDKYYVRCCGVTVGTFTGKDDAIRVNKEYRQAKLLSEWEAHSRLTIIRDPLDNAAVIALSGDAGQGAFSKVPDEFWHQLTFKTSWCLCKGYAHSQWKGKPIDLHAAVWALLHPGYKPVKGMSIDHRNPESVLDNRVSNLRLASRSEQERNKKGRGSTSKYPGVHLTEKGTFSVATLVEGKRYRAPTCKTEIEAAKAMNALRLKLFGPDTPLIEIVAE